MSDPITVPLKPSFGRRLLRFTARLLLVLILGIAIGAALYFGVPALYRAFIQPVQEHTVQIEMLELSQNQTELQVSRSLQDLQTRLQALESQSDLDKATIAELKASLEAAESAVEQLSQLPPLTASVEELQAQISTMNASLSRLQSAVATSTGENAALQARLSSQLGALSTAVAEQEALVSTMRQDVQWAIIAELLVRARYSLTQGNLGLAASDIASAIELLENMKNSAASEQVEALVEILAYLEDAQAALPRTPLVAADNLEGAWQLIIEGLLTDAESLQPAAPGLVGTPEVTTTATLETTPTQSPSPTPTP